MLRRFYELDPGLIRCSVALIAVLWGLYGKNLQRGRSPTRLDLYCDDAPWRDGCPRETEEPQNGDYSPALVNYPYEWWVAHELHHGRLAAWNPHVGLGAPTRVTFQGCSLSPFRIPFYIHPSPRTYDFGLLMQLFCAGFFAFLLARKLGAGDTGGLFAALAYMLSGFLTAYIAFSLAPAAAVLPALLYAIECLYLTRSWRAALGTALALALALSIGHPSTLFLSSQAGLLYFVTRAIQLGIRREFAALKRFLALGAGAAFVAALIVLGPWLGFAELLKNGYSYHNETRNDKEMETALDLMGRFRVPALLAPRVLEAFRGVGRNFEKVPYPHSVTPYVGIPVLALVGVALIRRRVAAPIIVILIWSAAIAYGPGPLAHIRHLPGYDRVFFFYAYYLTALMFAVAAALGLVELARRSFWWPIGVALAAVLILGAGARAIGRTTVPKYAAKWKLFVLTEVDTVSGVIHFWPGLWLFCGTALVLGIPRRTRKALPLALTVATAADLIWCTQTAREKALAFDPVHTRSEGLDYLRDRGMTESGSQRITGSDWRDPMINGAIFLGLRDIRQTDALQIDRYTTFMKTLDASNVTSFPTMRVTNHYYSPLVDLVGVRYILRERSNAKSYWKWRRGVGLRLRDPTGELENDYEQPLVYSDDSLMIYQNHRALPRAFLVGDAILAHDRRDALGELIALGRPGTEIRNVASTVVIEPAIDMIGVPRPLKSEPTPGVTPSVTWLRDDPNDQVLDVVAARDDYLVVSDTVYPGWKATIDGKLTPIFPADYTLRGIYVPPGQHRVELHYRPTWRKVESWISHPIWLLTILAFVFWPRIERRFQLA